MPEIEKYSLSKDKKGLCAWFKDEKGELTYYHTHSEELSVLERWIRELLLSDLLISQSFFQVEGF